MYLHVPNNSSIFICVSVIKKNLKHSQNYPLNPGKYNSEVKTFTRNRIPRFLVPQIRGADSWFNFLIRGKNRFSSAIRLSSTPFAIPRAPTLGMQPSFFFFSLGFHYSIYSPEPPITFVNGLSRREEFIASYLRFPACVPFEMLFSPSFVNSYATDLLLRVARHGKGSKKKYKKRKKGGRYAWKIKYNERLTFSIGYKFVTSKIFEIGR